MQARIACALALGVSLAACAADAPDPTREKTQLTQYTSCGQLQSDLQDNILREIDAEIDGRGGWGYPEGDTDSAGGASNGGSRTEGVDYSGTNNQENGVDEADFVKTDGYNIYVLNGNRLHIFGVPEFGQLTPESVTPIEGTPAQMLLDQADGRAVVFSIVPVWNLPDDHPLRPYLGYTDANGNWVWRTWDITKMTVLDVSRPSAPRLEKEVYLEGWYQTARRNDTSVRLATYAWIDNPIEWSWWSIYDQYTDKEEGRAAVHAAVRSIPLDQLVPRYYVRSPDGALSPNPLTDGACSQFYSPSHSEAYGMTSLYSFDLAAPDLPLDADNVVSNWPTLYASDDTLVLTEPAMGWWWYWREDEDGDGGDGDPDTMNVFAFDISMPGQTHFLAAGRVDGTLFDPYSIDAHAGTIRLATTDNRWGRWWHQDPPPIENHVWVLQPEGGELVQVGHLGGLAEGETIESARFVDDQAYLVTYHNVDPLLTIDLRDPTAPRLAGQLDVNGLSGYLKDVATGKVLSVGVAGDDQGIDWSRTRISLFDATDLAHPALQSTLDLPTTGDWSWSEAQWDSHAFQYWAPKNLLAVPVSTYKQTERSDGSWSWQYLSHLELINVDLNRGLSLRGTIDHSLYYPEDQYWYYQDIRRAIFMGDYIYAISDRAITVHRADDLQLVTMQTLPGYDPDDWYWWW